MFKVRKNAKIGNLYNQVGDHKGKGQKRRKKTHQETITHKRAKKSAISQQVITRLQGTDKTAQKDKDEKINNKKDPQKKYHLGIVGKTFT